MNGNPKTTPPVAPDTVPPASVTSDYTLLLDMLRPYRLTLAITLVLMLAQSVVVLINPWLAGRFAAAIMGHHSVTMLLLAWLVVIVVQSVLGYAVNVRLQTTSSDLVADGSVRVFDHLQSLPLRWHQERRHGDVLSLLTRDIYQLGHFVTGTLTPLLPLLLTVAGALLIMLRIQPWFALGAALLLPAVFIAMRLAGRRLRPLGHAASQAYATQAAVAEQALAMLPIIKAFTGEASESNRYDTHTRALRDIDVKLTRREAMIAPCVRIIAAAAVLVLLFLASRDVAAGTLSTANLVTLLLYGLLLTQPVSALARVYGQVQTARGAAQRLVDVFRAAPEPRSGNLQPASVRGDIVFDHVGFTHRGRKTVLDDANLHVRPGETVAITGVNGAGKSTLMHLLMRFADPTAGRITLDGHDLREFDLRSLRSHIGLVSQDVLLFNASIKDNIAYGRPTASQDDIDAATRLAGASTLIARLPEGYATRVGDRGVRLSGGEKQRVALARALLKNPAVMILDEATAMFDPEAEHAFVEACKATLHRRSVIIITHRPASLALADRVLHLDHGQLVALARELPEGQR